MEAGIGDLTLADVPSILSLCDDELAFVVRAAHSFKTLTPLASTCSRICSLSRSRVPVKLRLRDASSASMLLRLAASGRPRFSACESLVAVAKDLDACCQVPGVLVVAAGLANLRALDLTVSPPPTAAAAAAAAAAGEDGMGPELFDEISCSVAGLLAPMQWRQHGFQQLQQLRLEVPALGTCGAAFLGGLKQLTSLQLKQGRGWDANIAPPDLSFLEGMVNLVELEVDSTSQPMPLAAAAGPFCLPSSLQRLQLGNSSQTAEWLEHLPECPQLTQLHLAADTDEDEVPFHPAAMLELAARHTPGLRRLVWRAEPADFTAPAPLDQNPYWEQPLPLVAVSALTALQHLDAGGFLTINSAVGWEALSSLTSLTSLDGIVVYQAPPQQWQNMHVQQLGAALEDVSGREAAQLLRAFPAAQSIRLRARGCYQMPEADDTEDGGSGEQGVPRAPTNLTSLQLNHAFSHWEGDPPAVHAAPLLAAAAGVVELSLESCGWAWEGSCQLPDLSGCTAVTRLLADAYNEQVLEKDVVAMVQPLAPTLRVLDLQWMKCIPPQAAIALQDVLPHLEHVHFNQCRKMSADPAAGTEEEQLARLRQQLRSGLMLTVSP